MFTLGDEWDGKPLTIDGRRIAILGDPHLGRRFTTGVPLDRLGEREIEIEAQFLAHVHDVAGVDMHVCLGDLFDRPAVSHHHVRHAALTYLAAAHRNPKVTFVILAGNHDLSRDLEVTTAFEVLRLILSTAPNIQVVSRDAQIIEGMLFVPWSPIMNARAMVEPVSKFGRVPAAFGHWDVVNPKSPDNLIPPLDTPLVITGHVHRRRVITHADQQILVAGSMQPYAHGEDWSGEMYWTGTLEELGELSEADRRRRCLRIVLEPGQRMPTGIDARQITVMPARPDEGLLAEIAGSADALDIPTIWNEVMAAHSVPDDLVQDLFNRYKEKVNA